VHATDDQLVRRALGEPLPDLDRHADECPACAGELAALAATVDVARAEGDAGLPPAPDAVWRRITDELGLAPERPVPLRPRVQQAGRWLLAGAAALVAGIVLAVGLPDRTPQTPATLLAPVPASGPVAPDATGQVRLAADRTLVVEAEGLPAPDGYYEVWLLDPDSGRMLALGTLGDDGTARLPVPEGVAVTDYPTVDVSVEQDDGDPTHSGVSALRAPVPT
jgi:anti-sigma-K factor RskA